jgi:hypothetical protein
VVLALLFVAHAYVCVLMWHCCAAGLAGFDMPLVYVFKDKLNQPIFGCNNLAGQQQQRQQQQQQHKPQKRFACMWRHPCQQLMRGWCCGASSSSWQSMHKGHFQQQLPGGTIGRTTPVLSHVLQAHSASVAGEAYAELNFCSLFNVCCVIAACLSFVVAGQVWPAVNGGGPSGTLPPHSFKVLFKEVSQQLHHTAAVWCLETGFAQQQPCF